MLKKYSPIFLSLLLGKVLFAQSLSTIIVEDDKESQNTASTNISATTISQEEIQEALQGNGFISSLLKNNPNVTINDLSKQSTTAGEITPGKISFHDAPFYQNNFQIDGLSNNSLIDPAGTHVKDPYDVPGNENESFIDLDLIKTINVYDSNVSAEFGSFTGGVIDAKTIRPKGKTSAKFSYKFTNDSLTNFHIERGRKEEFLQAGDDNYQPRFKKKFYNMYVASPLDDSNGLIFAFSRKESIIPGSYLGTFKDKKRLNHNLFLKYSHYFDDDATIDISGTYAPYESTHHDRYVKDSDTKIKGGGSSLKANYEKTYAFWTLYSNFGLRLSENTKKSLDYNKEWLSIGDKEWGKYYTSDNDRLSKEGGSGNITKEQKGINYNFKLSSQKFKTKELSHKIKTGFALNLDSGSYNRKNNTYYYTDATKADGLICNGNNESCIDDYQYFKTRRVYQAEDVSVKMLSSAAYIENQIKYKNLELTPGLRMDYNDYLENADLAYRLNSSYKPFGNSKTVIFAGANRYYGKSFLGYKLREARTPYYDQYRGLKYPAPTQWSTSTIQDQDKYIFKDLDTPYSDELSLGIRQDIKNFRVNLKHVKRDSKKEFTSEYAKAQVFERGDGERSYFKPLSFTNSGSSSSQTTSIKITPVKASSYSWGLLSYSFTTAFNKTQKSLRSYNTPLEDLNPNDFGKVSYNGKVVDTKEMAIKSAPATYNLALNMKIKPFTIFGKKVKPLLNNSFIYRESYTTPLEDLSEDRIAYIPEELEGDFENVTYLKVYKDKKMDSSFTYDLKAKFEMALNKKEKLILSTEIYNVFDEVVNLANDINTYQTGRQFWFELAYKY